ncbi:50S ribosomal protein L28 [Candidatus Falkowbacteria bacterium]|nr:50S ribosomal protein L28 [Candidatus Falkowbacteria bacterium]MBT4433340.1 50S ribosomal protein L28 [Candidatus Falkowbacteria bacterium]
MSRRCEVCGRKALSGNSRSHSMVATKRKQYLNLQTKKIEGKKTKACTSCLKTIAKNAK